MTYYYEKLKIQFKEDGATSHDSMRLCYRHKENVQLKRYNQHRNQQIYSTLEQEASNNIIFCEKKRAFGCAMAIQCEKLYYSGGKSCPNLVCL